MTNTVLKKISQSHTDKAVEVLNGFDKSGIDKLALEPTVDLEYIFRKINPSIEPKKINTSKVIGGWVLKKIKGRFKLIPGDQRTYDLMRVDGITALASVGLPYAEAFKLISKLSRAWIINPEILEFIGEVYDNAYISKHTFQDNVKNRKHVEHALRTKVPECLTDFEMFMIIERIRSYQWSEE